MKPTIANLQAALTNLNEASASISNARALIEAALKAHPSKTGKPWSIVNDGPPPAKKRR